MYIYIYILNSRPLHPNRYDLNLDFMSRAFKDMRA